MIILAIYLTIGFFIALAFLLWVDVHEKRYGGEIAVAFFMVVLLWPALVVYRYM